MPFKYKRKNNEKRNRSKMDEQTLRNALEDIKNGSTIRGTANKYDIDRNTLRNYLRNKNKLEKLKEVGSQFTAAQVFTPQEEKSLADYLVTCSKMNYGLTRKEAMKLAVEFAKNNFKNIPQSWVRNNIAGKDWFRGFMQRNPSLSLRTPEATSLSRATSFNKKNVQDFYDNLKEVREKYKFEPQNMYNCDETGCTTVQDCPKVLASKKARQVGHVTSAERGTLVTACFAINALGNVIPPFFVFPRVKYNDAFVADGPEGSDGDSYTSGWMTVKSFVKFMTHFVKYSHASLQNPVLLILDNHESHVSVEMVQFAKANGVTLLTLPPHCSNKMQPLDVALYSSLKVRYNTAMSNWMVSNPGRTVTIYNIPAFVKTIMSQTFTQANILSGFRKTGIHPFNPDIFTEEDFLCSSVTDREMIPCPQDILVTIPANIEIAPGLENESVAQPVFIASPSNIEMETEPENQPATEVPFITSPSILEDSQSEHVAELTGFILPETIRPYPKAGPRKTVRRGRQPGKTKILTKTPDKVDQDIQSEPIKNKGKPTQNKKQKMSRRKTSQYHDSETEAESDENENRRKKTKPSRQAQKKKTRKSQKHNFKRKILQSSSESESTVEGGLYDDNSDSPWEEGQDRNETWYCFVCETDEKIDMRLCSSCGKYVHEMCVGLTKSDKDEFICPYCAD